MDKIDNMIENVMNKQIIEPCEYEQAILTAFDSNKYYKMSYQSLIRVASILCIGIMSITGGVFAKDISNWIYQIFNPNTTSKGIINMAENGYLYNTQMEYIQYKGNDIKINYIMMDDFNLNIVFDLKTKEKMDIVEFIEITDLVITDENNNLIYCCYNDEVYKNYCKENKLKYEKNGLDKNLTNGGYGTEIIEKTDNNIKFLCKMYSSQYPKSKKLFISFRNIDIFSNIQKNNKKTISGKWNMEIELPKEFYNRETISYTVKDNSDKKNDIILQRAMVSNTEMYINLTIKNAREPYNATKEEMDELINNILNNDDIITGNDVNIENERGEKFEIPTSDKEGNFSVIQHKDGNMDISMAFPITKYDYTNTLKLNLKVNGKMITINLSK